MISFFLIAVLILDIGQSDENINNSSILEQKTRAKERSNRNATGIRTIIDNFRDAHFPKWLGFAIPVERNAGWDHVLLNVQDKHVIVLKKQLRESNVSENVFISTLRKLRALDDEEDTDPYLDRVQRLLTKQEIAQGKDDKNLDVVLEIVRKSLALETQLPDKQIPEMELIQLDNYALVNNSFRLIVAPSLSEFLRDEKNLKEAFTIEFREKPETPIAMYVDRESKTGYILYYDFERAITAWNKNQHNEDIGIPPAKCFRSQEAVHPMRIVDVTLSKSPRLTDDTKLIKEKRTLLITINSTLDTTNDNIQNLIKTQLSQYFPSHEKLFISTKKHQPVARVVFINFLEALKAYEMNKKYVTIENAASGPTLTPHNTSAPILIFARRKRIVITE